MAHLLSDIFSVWHWELERSIITVFFMFTLPVYYLLADHFVQPNKSQSGEMELLSFFKATATDRDKFLRERDREREGL